MSKMYISPAINVVSTKTEYHLCAGSGNGSATYDLGNTYNETGNVNSGGGGSGTSPGIPDVNNSKQGELDANFDD